MLPCIHMVHTSPNRQVSCLHVSTPKAGLWLLSPTVMDIRTTLTCISGRGFQSLGLLLAASTGILQIRLSATSGPRKIRTPRRRRMTKCHRRTSQRVSYRRWNATQQISSCYKAERSISSVLSRRLSLLRATKHSRAVLA